MISHYHYWKRETGNMGKFPLQKRMIREAWSLERFCLGPEMKDFYTQFLWRFPPDRFDFVGITERYQTDFPWFSRNFLGKPLPVIEDNVNSQKQSGGYEIPESLREQIEVCHAADMLLYHRFLETSLNRAAETALTPEPS
jgi:hypothetical protein